MIPDGMVFMPFCFENAPVNKLTNQALDPDGKEGLAYLASSLLDEGAGDLDSQSFQRRLEELSIAL